jgi:hypothetical protein
VIDPDDTMRFFSGVRAIGHDTNGFLVSDQMQGGQRVVFVSRGNVRRRYSPSDWIDEALRELRAGIYGKP